MDFHVFLWVLGKSGCRSTHTPKDAGLAADFAVDQHGAGAALAPVAALLGAGQADAFAQKIEQGDPGIVERDLARRSVQGQMASDAHLPGVHLAVQVQSAGSEIDSSLHEALHQAADRGHALPLGDR